MAMPATTWRTSLPKSTSRRSSLSAPFTFSATFTCPTRISTLAKSSMPILPAVAVVAAVAGTVALAPAADAAGAGAGFTSTARAGCSAAVSAGFFSVSTVAVLRCCSMACIFSITLLSARGKTGSTLPIFVPSCSWPHFSSASLKFAISPSPSCAQMRQRGHHTQSFGAGVKNRSQTRPAHLILLLAQRPGLILHQVFVYRSHQRPGRFQRARELKIVEMRTELAYGAPGALRNLVIRRFARLRGRGIRHLPAKVARNHGQRAAGQVAQVIRQVGVIALHQRVEGKRPVLPEHDFAQQEITQRVPAHRFHNGFGAHHVAARLRHLVVLKKQ